MAKAIVTKALGEDSGVGANLITPELATEIYNTLATYGIWNTFAVRRMGTKQRKLIVNTERPVANFILTEGGTISDDSTKANTSVMAEVEVVAALMLIS